jgi:galactofuranose transport system substrate-binding protein
VRIWLRCAGAILVLVAGVVCCRKDRSGPPEYRHLIGVSQANLTEPWRIAVRDEIAAGAEGFPDLRVVFTDAVDSSTRQIEDVRRLLAVGIDLLIISPNDTAALTPVITEAHRQVPVILLDRSVEGYDYTLFLGPDNIMVGKQAGEYIVQLLGEKGGTVLEIQGRAGSPPVLDRSRGFREAIADTANVRIVDTIIADWLRDKAQDEVERWFSTHASVDVVFAQNDAMAYGAFRAAERQGIRGVRFVGIDGLPGPQGGIELVRTGILSATFTCPTGGKEALIYAVDILRREEGIPKKMLLRTTLVTAEELDRSRDSPIERKAGARGRKIVVGFAQVGRESEWRSANTASIQTAARQAGIELIFKNAEQSPTQQVEDVRSFISQKVDVIAFSPIIESGWEDVLLEAKAAGIPVIITDRAVDVQDKSLWLTLMGSDFVEEGRRAAKWLVSYMNTDRPVNVVELQGTIGSAPALDRKEGFEEVLREYPNYRIVYSESGDFFRTIGKQVMERILTELRSRDVPIDALFAHNDDMAIGAIEAMEEVGLKPGKDVVIVSVDAAHLAFDAMIAGKLNCTVECNPLLGPQLMKAIKDYEAGKELPVRIITAEEVFPAEVARKVQPTRKY